MINSHHYLTLVPLLLAIGSPLFAISIQNTVAVRNAGNLNDNISFDGTSAQVGGVSYEYYIGTYEVTNSQYSEFLNSVASVSDNYGLYNPSMRISRIGSPGSYSYAPSSGKQQHPVVYVSVYDAMRYCNWVTNGGNSSSSTESGIYSLNGSTSISTAPQRNIAAFNNGGVAIASRDEWFKAAYYDPNYGYYKFATQSDLNPTTVSVNFNGNLNDTTEVGSYASTDNYYGTYDQNGNVWEWVDTVDPQDTVRYFRIGGSFSTGVNSLWKETAAYQSNTADIENAQIGFRVTSLEPIPEPSAYALLIGGLALSSILLRPRIKA